MINNFRTAFLAFSGENIFKLNPASYTQEKMWAGIWNLCVRIFLLILLMMFPKMFGNSIKMNSSSFMLQV